MPEAVELEVEEALQILNLQPGASPHEVKAAYRRMLKDWHPDRYLGDAGRALEAEQRTRRIIAAYQTLSAAPRHEPPLRARSEPEWFELPLWTQLNPFRRAGRPAYPYAYTTWDRFAISGSLLFMLVFTVLAIVFDW